MASHKHTEDDKFSVRSAAKVFWDAEGVIIVEFLEQGYTTNSVQYVTILKSLKDVFGEFAQQKLSLTRHQSLHYSSVVSSGR
ncbi:hypothetical protein Trydic_g16536 [Trypoxylus dichotomus]